MQKDFKIHPVASLLIFISAYSPLSLIIMIHDYNQETKWFEHPIFVLVILAVSLLSCIYLYFAMKSGKKSTEPVIIKELSNHSSDLLNYSLPYIIAFTVLDLSNIKILLSFSVFMVIIFLLTIKTNSVFLNPILALMNYNLFYVKYKKSNKSSEYRAFFLVSNKNLACGDTCRIKQISNNFFLITDINPEV